MRGAVDLLKARLTGYQPSMVFVDLDTGQMPVAYRQLSQIQIEESDRVSGLDLRCVYGLRVSVSGLNAGKTKAIAQACEEAGATRVFAFISKALPNGEFSVIEMTDTEGLATWKA